MQLQDIIAQARESRVGRFLSEVQESAAKEFGVGSDEVRNALFGATGRLKQFELRLELS